MSKPAPEAVSSKLVCGSVKLDYVPVWIADEKEQGTIKFNRFSYRNVIFLKLPFYGLRISYFQSNVRVAGVLYRFVHQDIRP